jgi:capsular polysaccharide biosynthesis protein
VELRRYVSILRRHAIIVVLTVALAVGVGWRTTSRVKVFQAKATLFVSSRASGQISGGLPQSDPLVAAEIASATYARMIASLPTAQAAVQRTGVARSPVGVLGATSAVQQPGTTLIDIIVADVDPHVAASLANAEAQAFVDEIKFLDPSGGPGGGLPAYVFVTASVPSNPLPSSLSRNLKLSGAFGLLAAVAIALLLEYLDVTIRGVSDAEHRLELPVLGAIPLQRLRA